MHLQLVEHTCSGYVKRDGGVLLKNLRLSALVMVFLNICQVFVSRKVSLNRQFGLNYGELYRELCEVIGASLVFSHWYC